jgi:hypothetical protein
MNKALSKEQVIFYKRHGYLSPVDAIGPEKASYYRRKLEETEAAFGPITEGQRLTKPHLLFKWAADLVREPAILDIVEDVIGPDIMVYQLSIFSKPANSPKFINWHQDSTYFSLRPDEQVAAWVALSDASVEAGCMEVIPGSQVLGQLSHEDQVSANNMLSHGQTIVEAIDDKTTDFMALHPGQLSLHHTHLVHRSGPNVSNDRRIGFGISYVPAYCRCTSDIRVSASLVRGVDRYGHFEPEPQPKSDYDDEARAFHAHALKQYKEMRSKIGT